MSDHANVPPTYGTGFALTLTACFRDHDDVTECSDPRDTKSKSKIPSTLLTPLLRCGLLRTLSMLTFWSTMEVLPFHMRRTMPRSVNACISSVIVLPIIVSV